MTDATSPLSDRALRQFGVLLAVATALVFCLLLPWLYARPTPWWPLAVAGALLLFAAVWPAALAPIYRGWMRIGRVLGWINTRILLGAMFFLLIVPLGALMRVLGWHGISGSRDANTTSYRIPASEKDPAKDLTRPF